MNIEKNGRMQKIEFSSLEEFYNYICNTPINESFRWENLASSEQSTHKEYWTKTKSFEEASELFKKGWSEMAEDLTQRLKAEGVIEPVMTTKTVQSVEGYHPIVPLYLMGIPNNMVSRKVKPVKQKVVTLNKCITYSAIITSNQIIEESIKAFKLIKKLESQNYRVNLNILDCTYVFDEKYFVKIRLKSANEKLNISKMAFPLVHHSMLRRLCLRFTEVYPDVSKKFITGYGRPCSMSMIRSVWPNEILLPDFIRKDIDKIKTLDDLENL